MGLFIALSDSTVHLIEPFLLKVLSLPLAHIFSHIFSSFQQQLGDPNMLSPSYSNMGCGHIFYRIQNHGRQASYANNTSTCSQSTHLSVCQIIDLSKTKSTNWLIYPAFLFIQDQLQTCQNLHSSSSPSETVRRDCFSCDLNSCLLSATPFTAASNHIFFHQIPRYTAKLNYLQMEK